MTDKSKNKPQLPTFATPAELAEYLDKHDLSEFEDKFETVEFVFERPLIHVLEVELDAKSLDKMDALAHDEGVDAHSMARKWLLERLDAEVSRSTKSKTRKHAPKQSAG